MQKKMKRRNVREQTNKVAKMSIFGHFAKTTERLRDQNDRYCETNSNQRTRRTWIISPKNMVRTLVLRELPMRKQNTKRAVLVPLDAVPERRTKRCPPRFRPADRFCEPSFRYLSPGTEGEKCRPLDHM